jgi:glutathione synthase/RimK-type ligase-like ATP-grasp enzyme
MRQGLWNLLRDRKWINDPWQTNIAESKIWQLSVASEVGFYLPDTIITSDPKRVIRFHESHPEGIIAKLLGVSPLVGKVIYTNVVTADYMTQIDSVKFSPVIFQVLLKKLYELRITVVGEQIFSAKVYSQEDKMTAIDWRVRPELNDFDVRMEITTLPEVVETKIFELMRKLGLRYGCIDMVVTPTGDYVFLEINPSGQWHFVQLKTGAQIAEALANLLVE